MKITTIKMQNITDGKPFDNCVWKNASKKEIKIVYSILSNIKHEN